MNHVDLTDDELLVIQNALNYVLNAVELPQFSTLMGVEPRAAEELLEKLAGVGGGEEHDGE